MDNNDFLELISNLVNLQQNKATTAIETKQEINDSIFNYGISFIDYSTYEIIPEPEPKYPITLELKTFNEIKNDNIIDFDSSNEVFTAIEDQPEHYDLIDLNSIKSYEIRYIINHFNTSDTITVFDETFTRVDNNLFISDYRDYIFNLSELAIYLNELLTEYKKFKDLEIKRIEKENKNLVSNYIRPRKSKLKISEENEVYISYLLKDLKKHGKQVEFYRNGNYIIYQDKSFYLNCEEGIGIDGYMDSDNSMNEAGFKGFVKEFPHYFEEYQKKNYR